MSSDVAEGTRPGCRSDAWAFVEGVSGSRPGCWAAEERAVANYVIAFNDEARYRAGRIAVAVGWSQEVHRFAEPARFQTDTQPEVLSCRGRSRRTRGAHAHTGHTRPGRRVRGVTSRGERGGGR